MDNDQTFSGNHLCGLTYITSEFVICLHLCILEMGDIYFWGPFFMHKFKKQCMVLQHAKWASCIVGCFSHCKFYADHERKLRKINSKFGIHKVMHYKLPRGVLYMHLNFHFILSSYVGISTYYI